MSEAAKHGIAKLTDYQHARLRTEMYLGARTAHTQDVLLFNEDGPYIKELSWIPAAFTAFREGLDNSMDEVIGHKRGDKIWVDYDPTNFIITIEDNGTGIPIDFDKTHQTYIATMVLSETKAGRNFGERGQVAGTNGLGISIVNYCSEWFEAEIHRDNKKFTQRFSESMFDQLDIHDPVIKPLKTAETGTKVTFKLSPKVFTDGIILPEEFIRSRVYELAQNNPGVTFFYNREKLKRKALFEKGKAFEVNIVDKSVGFSSKFTMVPNFLGKDYFMYSDVNQIPAFNGGNHMDTFRNVFVLGMLDALEKESKRKRLPVNRSDILETLLIMNHTRMNAPNFDSQSKTRLINEDAAKIIRKSLGDPEIFNEIVKKNRDWIDNIFERALARTQGQAVKDIDDENKKVAKKKIAKLIEANSKNRMECILFIAEGDSAITGMSAARNPKIHAGLPLRGKILNVFDIDPKKVFQNQILSDMIAAIGLKIGHKAERKNLSYGKVFIAHDMDPDGFNIGALVVNFFYHYWPELFADKDDPFIYIFMTPFVIARKGKENKYWYGDDYEDFKPSDYKGWTITRAKGLSTLRTVDWQHALATPKIFPVVDDGEVSPVLDLLFNGGRADDRKVWLGDFE